MKSNEEQIKIIGRDDVKAAFMELLDLPPVSNNMENRNRLIRAYNYAYDAHIDMRRKSGEPYIFHPIEVAKIVATEIRLGLTSMIAALLHDVVEDVEEISIDDIRKEFGDKVAYIVNGLTKVTQVEDTYSAQVATYKKVLMSLSEDLRVVLIKIADRLHNMRTLGEMSEKNKIIKTGETLHVYAPLARKLGLNKIGRELEDLSFKHHLPKEYNSLMQVIEATKPKRDAVIKDFKNRLTGKLDEAGIDYEIKVIRKSFYSTWQMMNEQHLDFEDINNFQTLRLIFKPKKEQAERPQCYEVYVLITAIFNPRTGSMRDTIKNPLENGFEALTVDLMLSDGNWKEIQILSSRMSDIAERGYSSDKKIGSTEKLSVRERWLLGIKDQLVNVNQADDNFFDNFKLTLYTSEIYVYTPAGKMIKLPKGASVLDFAFQVDKDMGLHCGGAKVNKKITNHSHILESGDQVEILYIDSVLPTEEWLNHISSAKAKQTIENFLKKQKTEILNEGQSLYDTAIANSKVDMSKELSENLLKHFNCSNIEQLYFKLGKYEISSSVLSKSMKSLSSTGIMKSVKGLIGKINPMYSSKPYESSIVFNPKEAFKINDDDLHRLCVISQCCCPVAGDNAIAHKHGDGKFHIHRTECAVSMKLKSQEKLSIAKVDWKVSNLNNFKASIYAEGIDRKNLVFDVVSVISGDMLVNMLSIYFAADNGIYKGEITLDVPNIRVLNTLINKLKKINGVRSVGRNKS